MMAHLFYFFGLFIILLLFSRLVALKKYYKATEFKKSFKKVTGNDPKKIDFKDKEDYNIISGIGCILGIEGLWFLIGLISGNWIIFLSIIIVNLMKNLISKLLPSILNLIIDYIYIVIKILIVLFLVINHFHLHLDIIRVILPSEF